VLDFSAREWVGRDPALLVHPDDRDAFRAAVASCAPSATPAGSTRLAGDTTSVEVRMVRAEGGLRVVDAAVCNLLADPAVEGVVVTLRDVTDRKWSLELKKAKELAEEASRLKGQLLQNISHEFFTPMNHILGLTDIMLAEGPGPGQQEDLQQLRGSATDLLGTLKAILDFSQLEGDKLCLKPVPFRPRELVAEAVALWQPRAEAKGLALTGEVADDAPEVLTGDADRLRQVLLQLVSNAVKFTQKGEVQVLIERSACEGMLHWQVRDTGIGIPVEMQRRIFDPFIQADGSLSRQHGGTGLGLAIARSLVELMGGRLWLESVVASGSVFHFELPLPEASLAPLAT
jgi:protein-histidine pros-kinase